MKRQLPNNKREQFLRAYAGTGVISSAAKAAKVARQTHYEWLRDDPEYAAQFAEAHEEAVEGIESRVRDLAMQGNPILLMFLLKRHRPEYRDTHKVEHTGKDGAPLEVTVTFVDPS